MAKRTPEEQEQLLGKLEKFLDKFEAYEKGEGAEKVTKIPVKKEEEKEEPQPEKTGFFSWLFGE